jgi:hypothetical protein
MRGPRTRRLRKCQFRLELTKLELERCLGRPTAGRAPGPKAVAIPVGEQLNLLQLVSCHRISPVWWRSRSPGLGRALPATVEQKRPMNGYLWSGGAPAGLLRLGGSTSPQGRWNRSLPPFASARTPVDHGEVPNSSMAWRRQRSGAWHHSSADPEKRSLRIEASLNLHLSLSTHLFPQSERPVCLNV